MIFNSRLMFTAAMLSLIFSLPSLASSEGKREASSKSSHHPQHHPHHHALEGREAHMRPPTIGAVPPISFVGATGGTDKNIGQLARAASQALEIPGGGSGSAADEADPTAGGGDTPNAAPPVADGGGAGGVS